MRCRVLLVSALGAVSYFVVSGVVSYIRPEPYLACSGSTCPATSNRSFVPASDCVEACGSSTACSIAADGRALNCTCLPGASNLAGLRSGRCIDDSLCDLGHSYVHSRLSCVPHSSSSSLAGGGALAGSASGGSSGSSLVVYVPLCARGYLLLDGICRDFDECQVGNGRCEQICVNTPGSSYCACNRSSVLNADRRTCRDLNECAAALNPCHKGTCVNTPGSYFCICPFGFMGNGTQHCYSRVVKVFSMDFHTGPIADLKQLVTEYLGPRLGVLFVWLDYSLAAYCAYTNTCENKKSLKVVNWDNGWSQCPYPHKLRREFFEAYKADPMMQSVDLFVCSHPTAMCQFFMPFNKSMLIQFPVHPGAGRRARNGELDEWYDDLRQISANKRNVICANNLVDVARAEEKLKLPRPVEYMQNYCGYTGVKRWHKKRRRWKDIVPLRCAGKKCMLLKEDLRGLIADFNARSAADVDYPYSLIRLQSSFDYAFLASLPAIILIPHGYSFMLFMELYRSNVPIIVPKNHVFRDWSKGISLTGRPVANYTFGTNFPRSMMNLTDWNTWPYIRRFGSIDELWHILKHTDFDKVSSQMAKWNRQQLLAITSQWVVHLKRMVGPNVGVGSPRQIPQDYDQAYQVLYNRTAPAPDKEAVPCVRWHSSGAE